jgi:hypothetical protein
MKKLVLMIIFFSQACFANFHGMFQAPPNSLASCLNTSGSTYCHCAYDKNYFLANKTICQNLKQDSVNELTTFLVVVGFLLIGVSIARWFINCKK